MDPANILAQADSGLLFPIRNRDGLILIRSRFWAAACRTVPRGNLSARLT